MDCTGTPLFKTTMTTLLRRQMIYFLRFPYSPLHIVHLSLFAEFVDDTTISLLRFPEYRGHGLAPLLKIGTFLSCHFERGPKSACSD